MRKYMVILVNIVGNGENHPYVTSYTSDNIKFNTVEHAANHGFELTHSDDFLIGIIHDNKLISLLAEDNSPINYPEKEMSDIKDQLYLK